MGREYVAAARCVMGGGGAYISSCWIFICPYELCSRSTWLGTCEILGRAIGSSSTTTELERTELASVVSREEGETSWSCCSPSTRSDVGDDCRLPAVGGAGRAGDMSHRGRVGELEPEPEREPLGDPLGDRREELKRREEPKPRDDAWREGASSSPRSDEKGTEGGGESVRVDAAGDNRLGEWLFLPCDNSRLIPLIASCALIMLDLRKSVSLASGSSSSSSRSLVLKLPLLRSLSDTDDADRRPQ